ncbi:MAG: hypothetical protein ACRBB0_18605 [Pelagimonas sp.]|uniref:hypothetical protein n=1 Tax=Pelagimonas sp. TaxID=2073170 RepID=UPI003D6B74DC
MRHQKAFSNLLHRAIGVLRKLLPGALALHFGFWLVFFLHSYGGHRGAGAFLDVVTTALILTWYSIKEFGVETLVWGGVLIATWRFFNAVGRSSE